MSFGLRSNMCEDCITLAYYCESRAVVIILHLYRRMQGDGFCLLMVVSV